MIDHQEVQRKIEAFPALCRKAGMKVTPQRVAVYSVLVNTEAHPSAEEVFHAVRQTITSVSLGTVYKILDTFQAQGLLKKVATPRQTARYDARVEAHHHTVCAQCGKIEDLPNVAPSKELMERAQMGGFLVKASEIILHGSCGECAMMEAN